MIEERGRVIEVRGDAALVRAERTTACEKCATKSLCSMVSETDMVVEAYNEPGAKAGDTVVFTVGAGAILKAGVQVYLFPLLGFIFGVALGQVVDAGMDRDIVSAVFGFAMLALTYIGIALYERTAKKKARPTIIRTIEQASPGEPP